MTHQPRPCLPPHLGKVIVSHMVSLSLHYVIASPNRRNAPVKHFARGPYCSSEKPPPTGTPRLSPDAHSRCLKLPKFDDFLLKSILVTSCLSRYGNVEIQKFGLVTMSALSSNYYFQYLGEVVSVSATFVHSRLYGPPTLFLVARTTVQECGRARFARCYVTAAPPSHYVVLNIDGSSQSQLCNLQTGVVAWKPNHSKDFYLLSDICPHTFWLNECDECMLRSLRLQIFGMDTVMLSSEVWTQLNLQLCHQTSS